MKTHVNLFTAMLTLSACLVITSPLPAADSADFILFNGKVITVDSLDNIYQAVAISEGKVLQAGSDAEILALAGPQCKMIAMIWMPFQRTIPCICAMAAANILW